MSETESVMQKIHKLLAKAESTEFGPEAESLYAKAQELMLRHAIDEGMMNRAKPKEQRAKPVIEVYTYSDTGRMRMAKVQLFNTIAVNNGCKVVLMGGRKHEGEQKVYICGFPTDIEFVKLLFASLSITVLREGSRKFKVSGSGSSSNFIRNFYEGFTLAIGKRFREENEKTKQAEGESRALVLVDRSREVQDAIADRFGRLGRAGKGTRTHNDAHAHGAGFASGMSANLRPGSGQLGGSGQKLIG